MKILPFKHVIETLFWIPDKQGEIVPFRLNRIQNMLHDTLLEHPRINILKFRQGGVTTFVMAFFLIECMTRFCTAVMIAHDKEHTEKLLQRCRLMLRLMKGVKPDIQRENDQEIFFTKTNSTFYIGTAGSKNFGRSATITHLHCSEVAFWKDPQPLVAGLLQAVPSTGIVVMESTANGANTWYHQQWLAAKEGKSKFHPVFLPWYLHEEYTATEEAQEPYTEEEIKLMQEFGVTKQQLLWRREKIAEFGDNPELFRQEYPTTDEEAFLTSGGNLFLSGVPQLQEDAFYRWNYSPSLSERTKASIWILEGHPQPQYKYVVGVDVAAGTGRDYSVAQVLCHDTLEQVCVVESNKIPPGDFAQAVAEIAAYFNIAFVVPESNSHGLAFLNTFLKIYPLNKVYCRLSGRAEVKWGYESSMTGKPKLLDTLQKYLGVLRLYCFKTVQELGQFGEVKEGVFGSLAGKHDDHVISLSLACVGLDKFGGLIEIKPPSTLLKPVKKVELPPEQWSVVTFDDMMSRLPSRERRR